MGGHSRSYKSQLLVNTLTLNKKMARPLNIANAKWGTTIESWFDATIGMLRIQWVLPYYVSIDGSCPVTAIP
jgi:hypothetical protein